MRATREASGWKIEEPIPTVAAETQSSPKLFACESTIKPISVTVIPIGRE